MKNSAPTSALEVVLFDLDGTLVDTEKTAAHAIQRCFESWNITIKPEDAAYVTGRTWASAFEYLFHKYPLPLPADEAKQTLMRSYRKAIEEDLIPVAGGKQAVSNLATQFRIGLVSGSGRSEIIWALKKLEIFDHFEVILGAEDYPRSKPQPDGYLKALDMMGVSPKNAVVFEDSFAGISSARAAGAWVIAVTSTNHFQQDLSQAHLTIPDLTEVSAEWVSNLGFGE